MEIKERIVRKQMGLFCQVVRLLRHKTLERSMIRGHGLRKSVNDVTYCLTCVTTGKPNSRSFAKG